jgi:uncharacterized protein
MIKIHISAGEEVMKTVMEYCAKHKIREGAFVSIIGAVDECCIKTMAKKDPKKHIEKVYKEPMELSGTGEVREGKPHIHCVLGREDKSTISGHLEWARVTSWFVNLYLLPI